MITYKADITAGALKVPESRLIASLLLEETDAAGWKAAIETDNILQARHRTTAIRLAKLIRDRLDTMTPELWKLVRDGSTQVATHALLACAVKQSRLLADFLELVVKDHFRRFEPKLSRPEWERFLENCAARDPNVSRWTSSTRARLRSTVFQTLVQVGYLSDSRQLQLQRIQLEPSVVSYLERQHEQAVLRCLKVSDTENFQTF